MEKRIFGLETEYAVIIIPASCCSYRPTRNEIYNNLKEVISSHYKVLEAKEIKQGVFMENGGRFHHEACLNALMEGVIEFSTPECLNSIDVTAYNRAQDEILEEIRWELIKQLNKKGFDGEVFFGKNGPDNKGNFYGTHENYLVSDPIYGFKRTILYCLVISFFSVFTIIIVLFNLPILAMIIILMAFYVLLLPVNLLFLSIKPLARGIKKLKDGIIEIVKVILGLKPTAFTRVIGEIFKFSTILWAYSYGFCLRQIVFRKYNTYLIPFLMTRIIFSGSGRLSTDEPSKNNKINFSLSQKADAIKSVCTIFWDDYYRPIISLKNFIKNPWSVFKDEKRLHIMYSDSNMNDYVTYIKTGITGLVIRMIEEGHSLKDLRPVNPICAILEFSKDLTMKKKIPLKNGSSMSSLDIQKYYLKEAKKFYSSVRCDIDTEELLNIWENILNCIEINPHLLYKELDWVAKKDLINELLKENKEISFNRDTLKWIKSFSHYYNNSWDKKSEENLKELMIDNLTWINKIKFEAYLKRENITCSDFIKKLIFFHRIQKIDLKFHELNKEEGYFFKLVKAGLINKNLSSGKNKSFENFSPENTRGKIRGDLVKLLASRSVLAIIGWDEVIINNYARRIIFSDPFQIELTEEDKNYLYLLSP